jgi:NMT1-like family
MQATKASVENLILLEQGCGDVAFAIGDSLKVAWEGGQDAGFRTKLGKLRAIAAIYPNYVTKEVILGHSGAAGDWRICTSGRCRTLPELFGRPLAGPRS